MHPCIDVCVCVYLLVVAGRTKDKCNVYLFCTIKCAAGPVAVGVGGVVAWCGGQR